MSKTNDFTIRKGVLVRYTGTASDVVIPEGVTAIGREAFSDNALLRNVVIPEGVTEIREYAFYLCANLKTVVIPGSVTSIGFGAFEYCKALEGAALPEGLTVLGPRVFHGCESITRISVPAGVSRLEDGVFLDCCSLAEVELREGLTVIDARVFCGCFDIESIVIPEGVTSIGFEAFRDPVLSARKSILRQVTLPKSIRSIHKAAFMEDAKILFLVHKFSILSPKQRQESIRIFAQKDVNIPEPYRSIYLKHIKSKAAEYKNDAIQQPCLLELMHRENLIPAKDVQEFLEAAQNSGNAEAVALMLDYQVNHLSAAEKRKAGKKKEAREDTVFEKKLQRSGKTGIEGLTFAATTHVHTFRDRNQLKEWMEAKGGILANTVSAKVDYLITNGHADDSKKKIQAEKLGIEIITERQFNEMSGRHFVISLLRVLTRYVGTGGDVQIPEDVGAIGENAFSGCRELTSVRIPDRVTVIEACAFCNCTGLKQIRLPENVNCIGSFAFSDCAALAEIVIPEGVQKIENGTFEGCLALTKVVLPGSVTFIHPDAFTKYYGYRPPLTLKPTIHAPEGSYAETYAKENNIPFVAE